MRRIQLDQVGGPQSMRLVRAEEGDPGPLEVRVQHRAIGLNYIDIYHRSGLYPVPLPSGLGLEAAGVVTAVGREVTTLKTGDRVGYALGPIGAYADSRLIAADRLIRLPDFLDEETAAACLLKGFTAEYLVRRVFPVKQEDWVVVPAAAGGVGAMLGPWLAALGAQAIGVVGSADKAEEALAHGYAHVLVGYEDMAQRVRRLTAGQGCAVVYDGVGAATWAASLDCLRPRGMMVSFGNASGPVPPVDLATLASRGGLFVTRPSLFHYYADPDEAAQGAAAFFEMLQRGTICPQVKARYALADVVQAHLDMEARKIVGSAILVP